MAFLVKCILNAVYIYIIKTNRHTMKLTKNLERLQQLKLQPFYRKAFPDFTPQDLKDHNEYEELQKQITSNASKLKKGDKVVFNFPKMVKGKKNGFGLPTFEDVFYEGIVSKPLHTVKRSRMGEDCSFQSIKVSSGGYIYGVSLDSIEKI